jgi:hypothetical protein
MTTSQATTPERHPARFRSDRMEKINLSFDLETYDLICKLAKEEGCSVPALLRKAARAFLYDGESIASSRVS